MKLSEFIDKVAADSQSSKSAARAWTHAVLNSLLEAVIEEDEVELFGFGTFAKKVRKPKVGRNYKTGERVEIPAKMIVEFRMGKAIKRAMKDIKIPSEEDVPKEE